MITFTKEQLIASAHARIEFAEMMLAGELEPLKERTWSIELKLARIALASLEAEAVCVIDQSNLDYLKSGADADVWPASRTEMGDVLLYRSATPAPVSVPAAMEMDDDFDSAFEHGKAVGWNAYRAAMLQGAEPVTTANKLSFEQWLSQQTGTIDVECGCVMTEVFFHWLRVAYEAGNSPVIPDGWVQVPEEPTHEMLEAGDEQFGTYDMYRRMIAAAPQQEVK
ncbi:MULTISPECIES: hypothetical protein [unclassified Enterobacter cloacae complex]|uniref:hypothetical protein n=1 Tax=unclassified Enterobacter cloacae complex TaxID=2757714 RepID=UPI0021012067|nr:MULTISPECIES: hypothetical protein [unclassified Enterobacter cloacae complex]